MTRLLTRKQIVQRIKDMNAIPSEDVTDPTMRPVTLANVTGQTFYVLRVDEQDEAYYTEILRWHPIVRMPSWKCVDFLVNVEMEE